MATQSAVRETSVPTLPAWVKPDAPFEIVANADEDRAGWLEARKTLITAGEIPTILGITGGAGRLWYEKLGLVERRNLDEQEFAQMGHALEQTNADLFAQKTERQIERCQCLLRSKRYPWLGATLDFVQWIDAKQCGPLELKSTGKKSNWPDDDEPHMKYQAQLQAQMIVFGSDFGSLSAVIGAPYFHHRWQDYERHDSFCKQIIERTEAFWQSIQDRNGPPIVDDSTETNWALRHLALEALSDETVALPDEALEWCDEWERSKSAIIAWQKRKTYYENLLMAAIGTSSTGILPYGQGALTLKVHARRGYVIQPHTTRLLRRVP